MSKIKNMILTEKHKEAMRIGRERARLERELAELNAVAPLVEMEQITEITGVEAPTSDLNEEVITREECERNSVREVIVGNDTYIKTYKANGDHISTVKRE